MPATPDDLFTTLAALGIKTSTIAHAAMRTVEDSRALRGQLGGAHCKNLFVKDKKSRLFLLAAEESAVIDLKQVHTLIGASGRVSFGSADLLLEVWGVTPGSVTPFGAVNDTVGRVTVVLEQAMMARPVVNFHPLTNTRTTSIAAEDLVKFLKSTGHEPLIRPFQG